MTEFHTLLTRLGWSIPDAMYHLGLAFNTLYQYDRGTRKPHKHTLAVMRMLADAKGARRERLYAMLKGDTK